MLLPLLLPLLLPPLRFNVIFAGLNCCIHITGQRI
jgi:hypothetical protein